MWKSVMTMGGVIVVALLTQSTHAAETAAEPTERAASPLDLRPPRIGEIFTVEEINAVLARALDPALEHIEVEALPLGDLPLRDNSASTAESFVRTVTWLIFGPRANPKPDATNSYRPPPVLASQHHAAFDPP